MTDTTITAPSDEQIAAARSSADDLVASSVADLVVLIEGADLLTLRFALEAEQAKGVAARKGAVAALEAAIGGHPELAAQAAAEVDKTEASESNDSAAALVPTEPVLETAITTVADEPLEDAPADPDAISSAPPRPHQSLVDQLDMRWIEMKEFVRHLEGDVEHELGELLAFVRSKL